MKINSILLAFICFLICSTQSIDAQNSSPAQPYGDSKLVNDFVNNEMVYPEAAFQKGIEGIVSLQFLVDEKGEVKDLRIKEGVAPSLDAEAIRIFRMLLWEPATRLGNPVASENEFQVKFNIKKYKRILKNRKNNQVDVQNYPADTSLHIYKSKELDQAPKPVFSDRNMNLKKFLTENLKYPDDAYRQSLGGTVSLGFIVEPNGHISNITIEKPVAGGCSQEAIRLLQLLNWSPGIKGNLAVRTSLHLDITFRLANDGNHQIYDNSQISNY
jgi:TonB family protein